MVVRVFTNSLRGGIHTNQQMRVRCPYVFGVSECKYYKCIGNYSLFLRLKHIQDSLGLWFATVFLETNKCTTLAICFRKGAFTFLELGDGFASSWHLPGECAPLPVSPTQSSSLNCFRMSMMQKVGHWTLLQQDATGLSEAHSVHTELSDRSRVYQSERGGDQPRT